MSCMIPAVPSVAKILRDRRRDRVFTWRERDGIAGGTIRLNFSERAALLRLSGDEWGARSEVLRTIAAKLPGLQGDALAEGIRRGVLLWDRTGRPPKPSALRSRRREVAR